VTHDLGDRVGDLSPGARLASYEVQQQVGRGGMAAVYRAFDLGLSRLVALKVLAPDLADDNVFRQRFIRESRAAAAVEHPHIIPVFDAGEADGRLFIAMRYVERGDLRRLLDAEGPLSPGRVAGIAMQVASALDAAHAHGLVHRDVKPGNVLLADPDASSADYVYLSDFGLSKHSLTVSTLTATGQFFGTLDYVAPEQIQGQPVDGRADQYGLACTVVEMLAGTPPFKRDRTVELMWAQLQAPPPRLSDRRPDLPLAIDAVIQTALAKSPYDRFATCSDFAAALWSACAARPGRPVGPNVDRAPALASAPGPGPAPARLQPAPPTGRDVVVRRTAAPRDVRAAPRNVRAGPGGHRSQRRNRSAALVAAAALIGIAGLAAIGYALFGHRPAAAATATPQGTVTAYFRAINKHDYAAAWKLQADVGDETFQQFTAGFAGTSHDAIKIISVRGNLVNTQLTARQADGSVKRYAGTYTVSHGVIVKARVHQIS
jgi:hypothetical protein